MVSGQAMGQKYPVPVLPSMSDRRVWEGFCAPYEMLAITRDAAWNYGEIYRELSGQGQLMGTNNLWIAATALTHQVPVATGNVDEFRRVADLEVVAVA